MSGTNPNAATMGQGKGSARGAGALAPPMSVDNLSSGAYRGALASAGGGMGPISGNYTYRPATRRLGQGSTIHGIDNFTDADMGSYMNPYTDNVIDRAIDDSARTRDLMLDRNAADASAAGAFGGSRHGLVDATTQAEIERNLGDRTSMMREGAFTDAANRWTADRNLDFERKNINTGRRFQQNQMNQAARNQARATNAGTRFARDQFNAGLAGNRASLLSGLAGQGFDISRGITGDLAGSGAQQQQLLQGILSGGADAYSQYTGSPAQSIAMLAQGIHGNPLQAAQTQSSSYKPGFMQMLGLGGQAAGMATGKGGGK